MMWMPLRESKMNCFILGFQCLGWRPKWTPDSSNSLTRIRITAFLLLSARGLAGRNHPAEDGIDLVVIVGGEIHSDLPNFVAVQGILKVRRRSEVLQREGQITSDLRLG